MTNSQLLTQGADFDSTRALETTPTRAERVVETAPDAFIGFEIVLEMELWNLPTPKCPLRLMLGGRR